MGTNEILLIGTLAVILLTAGYINQTPIASAGAEGFTNMFAKSHDIESASTDSLNRLAEFNSNGLPLSDFLDTDVSLTDLDASGCAAEDSARQTELGGQFVQRTNNYRHEYPDRCSSLRTEFVGSIYKPKSGGVGTVVPCAGTC